MSLKVIGLIVMEKLGNIDQCIAAIATLVTLVWLAMQIKQNTKAVKATTFMEPQHFFASLHDQLAHDPQLPAMCLHALKMTGKQ